MDLHCTLCAGRVLMFDLRFAVRGGVWWLHWSVQGLHTQSSCFTLHLVRLLTWTAASVSFNFVCHKGVSQDQAHFGQQDTNQSTLYEVTYMAACLPSLQTSLPTYTPLLVSASRPAIPPSVHPHLINVVTGFTPCRRSLSRQ